MHYAIVDIETTGGNPKSSKITEIAIYKSDGKKIIDQYVTLVNPEIPIPDFIVKLTGITNQMVQEAPRFFEIAKQIVEFTEDCIFVAHNVAFDYSVIRHEFKSLGYDYRRKHLCTVRASRYVIPNLESYSLGKLSRNLGIELKDRHRAGGDAYATAILFQMLVAKDAKNLATFIQDDINPKEFNPNFDISTLDEIPDKAGVYKFFNEVNQIIYIGKSKHIKKRIHQHFRNTKTKKGLQLIKETTRIEFELTGSELIALLLESKLIKQYKPIFNSALKRSKFPFGLYQYTDEAEYIRFYIASKAKNKNIALTSFTTKNEAIEFLHNWVIKYNLCQKLCDLYQSNSSCFQYTIKECKGACVKAETPEDYNERANLLLQEFDYQNNHFYIIEPGRQKGEKSVLLIENNMLTGYGFIPFHSQYAPVKKWRKFIQIIEEDKDTFNIIKSYLRLNPELNIVSF